MSAISGYISTIQNAVYGEQVRGAIVNALEQCYSDVESPSLNQAAFTAAINAAYAGGILDIVTVTQISQMTNQRIIYRYNGTETGKQKGLYYYSALSSSWVLIGSEIHSVSNSNQMTDTNAIYKYTGTQTGMIQNSLYCYNGTAWIPIGSGVLTASTAAQMTNTDAIYKYTGTESGYITNSLYYYNGTEWVSLANYSEAVNSGESEVVIYDWIPLISTGGINASTGEVGTSQTYRYSDFYEIYEGITTLLLPFVYRSNTDGSLSGFGVAFYDENKGYLTGESFGPGPSPGVSAHKIYLVPAGAKYFRFTYLGNTKTYIYGFKSGSYFAKKEFVKGLKSGQANALAISQQMTRVCFKNGDTYRRGLVYSSPSVEDGYIGCNVSLYTFLSAVNDPNSVYYQEESKGYTGTTYYGTVCTSLICAAWGIPLEITTRSFANYPANELIEEIEAGAVEVGDMILSSTHARIVADVIRDENGFIKSVQTYESIMGGCIENNVQSYQTFKNLVNSDYRLYRYKGIDGVDAYVPSPFVRLMNEPIETGTFPDIVTYYGDKITRKYGTNIPVHVLNSNGYSSIEVYKDGTLSESKAVGNFTMQTPTVGEYEIRMVGTNKQSSTFFDIVDCSAVKDGNTLSVTTTNNLLAVSSYPTYTVDSGGHATSWNNPDRLRMATKAERTSGTISLDGLTSSGGLRVYVSGKYGSVSWEYPWSYFE